MSEASSDTQQVVPDRRRRVLILVICSMSLLIVGLDITIVNVALPSIHRDFHSSFSGLQWTIDAYTLVLASLLMVAGSTADRIGRRKVFQIGLATFSLGSLLCALAPSLPVLIGARVLQAIGGSMLNPVAMSIIRNVFTDPRERAQAIGVWGAMVGISVALGPVLGGILVDCDLLAGGVPRQRPDRSGRDPAHRPVCARVTRRPRAPDRSRRPAARHSRSGLPRLFDH